MQEIWLAKAVMFIPKIICAIAGAILALVLSGDIDQDGYIKINRGVRLNQLEFASSLIGHTVEIKDLKFELGGQSPYTYHPSLF